jgi:heme/copper-type cytochrome/quinol oxidase subunit 3
MILFIISEAIFFVGLFWRFFHRSLRPSPAIGCLWPPKGIISIDPTRVPFLNTVVLLSSGSAVSYRHARLRIGRCLEAMLGLVLTIFLGIYFTYLQLGEYKMAPFSMIRGVYGSVFFITTGFHGLHVVAGTCFLMVCLYRLLVCQFSTERHLGFDIAV